MYRKRAGAPGASSVAHCGAGQEGILKRYKAQKGEQIWLSEPGEIYLLDKSNYNESFIKLVFIMLYAFSQWHLPSDNSMWTDVQDSKCLSFVRKSMNEYMETESNSNEYLCQNLDLIYKETDNLRFFRDSDVPSLTGLADLIDSCTCVYEGAIDFSISSKARSCNTLDLNTIFYHLGTSSCEACVLSKLTAKNYAVLNTVVLRAGEFFPAVSDLSLCTIDEGKDTVEWTDIKTQIERFIA